MIEPPNEVPTDVISPLDCNAKSYLISIEESSTVTFTFVTPISNCKFTTLMYQS